MIVLDSGAFLAMIKREPGGFEMRRLLRQHAGEAVLHAAQLLEIYYGIQGGFGAERAERVWAVADKSRAVQRNDRDRDRDRDFLRDAAFVKLSHKMSFADSFAIALARRLDCPLVSTDHREFDAVKAAGVCDVLFIR